MTTSENGRRMIESFEGLKTTAYQDMVGIWTIGYGHTGGVVSGQTCTAAEADALLAKDLKDAESCIAMKVNVTLSQHEFDALVSFTFNLGCGAFSGSTLRKLLNEGDRDGASKEFTKWIHAGGKVVAGLVTRRTREQEVFLYGYDA